MNLDTIVFGTCVELPHMLNAREQRAFFQKHLIDTWHLPLISFTLNIPAPIKVFPLAVRIFEEGIRLIKNCCHSHHLSIIFETEIREFTGYEAFFLVDAPALSIKKILCHMEENISVGRIFDIDIIDTDGSKVSREQVGLPPRNCLICSQQAFVCSRSRTHSIKELLTRECEMMIRHVSSSYARHIASLAARALLYEVCVTPKPGLVDRNNQGAHQDMDIFTFQSSALTLEPFFESFVLTGIQHWEDPPEKLFARIRPLGIEAEEAMLLATGGVNTHKGIIFSMGIFCSALGQMFSQSGWVGKPGNLFPALTKQEFCSQLSKLCRSMTADLLHDFKNLTADSAKTHGEQLYIRYGITGIRGEANQGYPAVFSLALPVFEQLVHNCSINDAGVLTLLHIIAEFEDTNLIARSDYHTMKLLQKQVKELLLLASDSTEKRKETGSPGQDLTSVKIPEPLSGRIFELDQQFIVQNVSPGGSADILALTYFIWLIEQEIPEQS